MAGGRIEQILRNPAEAIGSPALLAAGGLSGFLSTAVASLDLLDDDPIALENPS